MMFPSPGQPMDTEQLRLALNDANIPALLMVLFQLTGDRRWLESPYQPTATRGLGDHASGGLPEGRQEEIRNAAARAIALWNDGQLPAVPAPEEALLRELMTICMGEPIPDEYAGLMSVEMGFTEPEPTADGIKRAPQEVDEFSVLIIGAGVSGLAAALRLKQAGIPYEIVEKNSTVGGTWLDNRYPGCGVDTPSHLYSFSFFPRNWSTHFSRRAEVAQYMEDMADHFDLRSSIRFETEVVAAIYDNNDQVWRVTVRNREGKESERVANAVISAVGLFNTPNIPNLPGMKTFRGSLFHSADWPENVDLTGKRVAVVGTGASAMQTVPAIVDRVDHLYVFQRSPQWIAPNEDYFKPISKEKQWLFENVPYYRLWYRMRLAWVWNDKVHPTLQRDPEWRHPERAMNAVNDAHRKFFKRYLQEQLEGREDLQQKALPDFPPYAKRILLDNGWFAALREPHVELVTESVSAFLETGVRTASGQDYQADIVVLCTGFKAQTFVQTFETRGRSGRTLQEVWDGDDASAYLGMTTPDFPNFFIMYGPNTNPPGGSYIFTAECQANYIVQLLLSMLERNVAVVECRRDVHDTYNRAVDEAHNKMVWRHPGVRTYYHNSRGRVVTNSPWRVVDYWRLTRTPNLEDFHLEPIRQNGGRKEQLANGVR